jgi:hypothetical protein
MGNQVHAIHATQQANFAKEGMVLYSVDSITKCRHILIKWRINVPAGSEEERKFSTRFACDLR